VFTCNLISLSSVFLYLQAHNKQHKYTAAVLMSMTQYMYIYNVHNGPDVCLFVCLFKFISKLDHAQTHTDRYSQMHNNGVQNTDYATVITLRLISTHTSQHDCQVHVLCRYNTLLSKLSFGEVPMAMMSYGTCQQPEASIVHCSCTHVQHKYTCQRLLGQRKITTISRWCSSTAD